MARVPTTTAGTVSSPPLMARTLSAAARSSQMLTHVAGTWARRSLTSSIAQYGHPGRQYTSTQGAPAAGFKAALLPGAAGRGSALDPHAAPERHMSSDPLAA